MIPNGNLDFRQRLGRLGAQHIQIIPLVDAQYR